MNHVQALWKEGRDKVFCPEQGHPSTPDAPEQLSFIHHIRLPWEEPYASLKLGHWRPPKSPLKSPLNIAVFRVADTSKVLRIKG